MKKIINGKMYNTETATYIDGFESGESISDFKYFCETLYIKKTGEFFISGEGGAMSKYSRSCGNNSYIGGSGIIPLTKNDALEWLENNSDVETTLEYFPDIGE